MAQERIELRFSPRKPDEKTVIEALGALDNDYGAKSRFLRERLLKGFVVLHRELEVLLRQEDPMAALERHPLSTDPKHYRVLKVLLSARLDGRTESPAAGAAATAPAYPLDVPATPVRGHDWSAFAGIAGVKRER